MTNEKILLRLINACIDHGCAEGGERGKIVVQLSPTYLPENILTKAHAVLERMRPEELVLHCGVDGEDVVQASLQFNPEDLPDGIIPPPREFARYPDGIVLASDEKEKGDPGDGG